MPDFFTGQHDKIIVKGSG